MRLIPLQPSAASRPDAGAVHRRRHPLGHDAAAADARRAPRARDPARDPLRPRRDRAARGRAGGRRRERPRGDRHGDRHWGDFNLDADELRARLEALDRIDAGAAIRAFFELYAEREGKPRWGDKTPHYLRRMLQIQGGLPEARFIHMIRDGRDAALSRSSRLLKEPPPMDDGRRALAAADPGRATTRGASTTTSRCATRSSSATPSRPCDGSASSSSCRGTRRCSRYYDPREPSGWPRWHATCRARRASRCVRPSTAWRRTSSPPSRRGRADRPLEAGDEPGRRGRLRARRRASCWSSSATS